MKFIWAFAICFLLISNLALAGRPVKLDAGSCQNALVLSEQDFDSEPLAGTIVEPSRDLVVPTNPDEASTLSLAQRKIGFQKLAKKMLLQARNQDGIFVNSRRISRFKLSGIEAFKVLRAFHLNQDVGAPGDRDRHIFIQADLDYVSSQSGLDPKDKLKKIETHLFKKQVSERLVILAALIEEPTSAGKRLDRLIV